MHTFLDTRVYAKNIKEVVNLLHASNLFRVDNLGILQFFVSLFFPYVCGSIIFKTGADHRLSGEMWFFLKYILTFIF